MVACFRFADGSIGNLTYCTVGSKTSGGERVEAYMQGLGHGNGKFQAFFCKRFGAPGERSSCLPIRDMTSRLRI